MAPGDVTRLNSDAVASAYLHPLADAVQVGHILRGPAHCVIAQMQRSVDPTSKAGAVRLVLDLVTPPVIEVLLRYHPGKPQPSCTNSTQ